MSDSIGSPIMVADTLFSGEGEMQALMRGLDWAATPLGPPAGWPQSLRTATYICLNSRFPIVVLWGPELVMLYNTGYRPVLGDNHPQALGRPIQAVWPEIWHIIGPMLQGVLHSGQATWSDDQLLVLERHGYAEECYFTFSYSPILGDDGRLSGIFTAVAETTLRVLAERRLATLRDLAAGGMDAKSAAEAWRLAMTTLAENRADVPFALLYLLDEKGEQLHLAGTVGVEGGTAATPSSFIWHRRLLRAKRRW